MPPRLLWLLSTLRPNFSIGGKCSKSLFSKSLSSDYSSLASNSLSKVRTSLTVSRSELVSSQSRIVGGLNGVTGGSSSSGGGNSSFGAIKFGVRFDSTKRKRKKMMNKHKYEKRMKTLKSLSSLNIRGGKSRVG